MDKKSKSLKKILSFWGYESVGFSVLRPTDFTSTKILLRPKLYFDLYFSTNNKSRFEKRSKYRGRSKDGEVERSKYRKGRRYENGRSTEKVERMRIHAASRMPRRRNPCHWWRLWNLHYSAYATNILLELIRIDRFCI